MAASDGSWNLSADSRSLETKLGTVNDVIFIYIIFCDGWESLNCFSVILNSWSRNTLVILAICKLLRTFLPEVILSFYGHGFGSLQLRGTVLRSWKSISDLS